MAEPTTVTDGDNSPSPHLLRLWAGANLIAIALFWYSVSQTRLVLGAFLVVLAATLGMIAVFAILRLVAQEGANDQPGAELRTSSAFARWSFAGLVAGVLVAWLGYSLEWQWLTAIGAVAVIHGGTFFVDYLNQQVQPSSNTAKVWYVIVSSVVIVFSLAALSWMDGFDRWTGVVIVALVAGVVFLKLSIVQYAESHPTRRLFTWLAALLCIVLAVVFGVSGGQGALVWAAGLLLVGLSVLGLLLHNAVGLPDSIAEGRPLFAAIDPEKQRSDVEVPEPLASWKVAAVAGVVFAVAGFWLTSQLIESFAGPFGVMVVIMIVGLFFVLPGETVFGAVLAGMMIVWIAHDTDGATVDAFNETTAEEHGEDAADAWLVAIGDSYISGEGASDFFAGTNSPESNDCRRAPTAYPQLVGRELGMPVLSFACSGATTEDLLSKGQETKQKDVIGGEPQLDALEAWLASPDSPDVDIVLVSIGGNDSGFGDVIAACLTPNADCSEAEAPFNQRVASLAPKLDATYERLLEILTAADLPGGLPTILVSQYPDPVGDVGVDCNLVIGADESRFIRRFRTALNLEVADAVGKHPELQLSGAEHAAVGHELCSSDRYINWLRLTPTDGSIWHSINLLDWKNGSLHPNEGGHCVAALLVLDTLGADYAIDDFDCEPAPGQAEDLSPIDVAFPAICTGNTPLEGAECTSEWSSDAFRGSIQWLLAAAAALIAAGMFVAVAMTSVSRTDGWTGTKAAIWLAVRRSWIDYDKVANGKRANSKVENTHATGS